jgi:hypothetical protein
MNSVQHIANVCRVQPIDINEFLVERGFQTKGPSGGCRFVPTQASIDCDAVEVKEFPNHHAIFPESGVKTVLFWSEEILQICRKHFSKSFSKDLEGLARKLDAMQDYVLTLERRVAELELELEHTASQGDTHFGCGQKRSVDIDDF